MLYFYPEQDSTATKMQETLSKKESCQEACEHIFIVSVL